MKTRLCDYCGKEYQYQRIDSRFCSQKCGAAHRWKLTPKDTDHPRRCLVCRKEFFASRDANQKRICSDECRRARNDQKVREWHKRNPDREQIYRLRTKAKQYPDKNLIRFRRHNPDAPMSCEICGESRVLDLAHKPGFERNGQHRSVSNSKWPEMVWVLCPTCHALLDRMHYTPAELGLLP